MAMPQRDDPPSQRLRRTGTIEAIKSDLSRLRACATACPARCLSMPSCMVTMPNASATKGPAGALVLRKVAAVAGRPPYRREDECGIISR